MSEFAVTLLRDIYIHKKSYDFNGCVKSKTLFHCFVYSTELVSKGEDGKRDNKHVNSVLKCIPNKYYIIYKIKLFPKNC